MANLKIKHSIALQHVLKWDSEVGSLCLLFRLPAHWCSGSLCLLCGFHRFLQEQGWRACSDTSKMPRHTQKWRTLPRTPGNTVVKIAIAFPPNDSWWVLARSQTDHSLIRILSVVGDVEQVCVLQLFTEPLQQRQRLVESHWHGNSGQVFANVVVQDGHDADVAVVGSLGGEGGAAAYKTTSSSVNKTEPNERNSQCSVHSGVEWLWFGGDVTWMICFLKGESWYCREVKVKPCLQWFCIQGQIELFYSL